MSAKTKKNAGGIDLSKLDLDSFTPRDKSYAQQLAEIYFNDHDIAIHLGKTLHEEYAEVPLDWGSDNNYVPNIEEALKWAQQLLKKNNANVSETYPAICYSCLTDKLSYNDKVILSNFTGVHPDIDKLQCSGCFDSLIQGIFNKIKSGEILPEEARKIAAHEFEKIEGWETEFSTLAYDGSPELESWHASQIINSFKFLEALLNGHEARVMNPKAFEKHLPTAAERLDALRINFQDQSQTAFKIGFLYHDAWWKARHEEAARKHYEMLARNKTNGQNGGDVNSRKKTDRYRSLDALAIAEIGSLTHVSDKEAIRVAKSLARRYDKGRGEKLFQNKGKDLSNQWYSEWLALFRARIRKQKQYQ